MCKVLAFIRDESAATAIEYCLIAGGISIVVITGVNAVGTTLNTTFALSQLSSNSPSNYLPMPAFGGKADIAFCTAHVFF